MKPTKKAKCYALWCGLRRHPWLISLDAFAAFSVFWTLTQGITHFLGVKIEGGYNLTAIVLVSLAFGLNRFWKPSRIAIKVAATNTRIEVLFGDIFSEKGLRGIGVTEFFESELGVPVSEKSLHGLFLQKCFGGGSEDFNKQLEQQLKESNFEEVDKKDAGKTKAYPIGTTACVKVGKDKYILFALAEADRETCKAASDVAKMWVAMHGLWQKTRIEAGGHPLNIPLIGSGLSGIGLPSRELLNLIILSAITETKVKQITRRIRIVLHLDQFEEINLRDVKKYWEE